MSTPEEKEWEFKLKFVGFYGPAKLYAQGGSMRLTLPRSMVRRKRLDLKVSKGSPYYYFVIETNKGFLLVQWDETLARRFVVDRLKFVDLSSLSKEDLEALIQE